MRMKGVMLVALCVCSFLASANAHGQSRINVTYSGQESEILDLERTIDVTRYRSEQYQGTCTRQVPYTARECRDETRYRQECHYVDGHQECRTDYENECHYVTRYRRECHNRPGRQVCRTEPGRRICRNHNGRQVCRNAPGRRVCHTVPGRRVCSNNPYQDYVCETVPRRRCDYIPGRNVCSQIPYSERVCEDVTRYRSEEYACTQTRQVPYIVKKDVKFSGDIIFENQGAFTGSLNIVVKLTKNGKTIVKVIDQENGPYFITIEKNLYRDDREDSLIIDGSIIVKLIAKDDVLSLVKKSISLKKFSKRVVKFVVGNSYPLAATTFDLKIVRQRRMLSDLILINRSLSENEYELRKQGDKSILIINLSNLGIVIKDKNHQIELDVKLDLPSNLNVEQTHYFKHAEFNARP